MAFTLQDDTGSVAGANAYIDETFFKAHHDERGNTYTDDTTKIRQAIVRATEWVDIVFERRFPGTRLAAGQTTAFPRAEIYEDDGKTAIVGVDLRLKKALAELARYAMSNPLTVDTPASTADTSAVIYKREKVGQIEDEVRYKRTPTQIAALVPMFQLHLRPLLSTAQIGGTYR
jgi:hypothetical protein